MRGGSKQHRGGRSQGKGQPSQCARNRPHPSSPHPRPAPCLVPNRYDAIDTSALEEDNANIFGNVSEAAGYKYLLSLEGHSYWYLPDTCLTYFRLHTSSHPLHSLTLPYTPYRSFRLRHLLHLGSAVLHQQLPCHEFWRAIPTCTSTYHGVTSSGTPYLLRSYNTAPTQA